MREVLILRHAKSSWKDAALSDHDRPLNGRGRRAAPRMGELILSERILPDHVLCSSAKRTRTTAKLAMRAAGYAGRIEKLPELYLASSAEILDVLATASEQHRRIMVVGHNPGMASLVAHLTGHHHAFPTAALAHVSLDIERWHDAPKAHGGLLGFWLPRELA
jgi:phosphohistidine phosphatase